MQPRVVDLENFFVLQWRHLGVLQWRYASRTNERHYVIHRRFDGLRQFRGGRSELARFHVRPRSSAHVDPAVAVSETASAAEPGRIHRLPGQIDVRHHRTADSCVIIIVNFRFSTQPRHVLIVCRKPRNVCNYNWLGCSGHKRKHAAVLFPCYITTSVHSLAETNEFRSPATALILSQCNSSVYSFGSSLPVGDWHISPKL